VNTSLGFDRLEKAMQYRSLVGWKSLEMLDLSLADRMQWYFLDLARRVNVWAGL